MKYLKLFEGFNKDDFYIESDIDISEIRDLISHPSESIYNRLSKIIDDKSNYPCTLKKNQSLNNTYGLGDIRCIGIDTKISDSTYTEFGIYSMDDEYYFVSYHTWSVRGRTDSEFYKCDQYEGLVKLLKDKGLIK